MIDDTRLRQVLEEGLGRPVGDFDREPLGGGCINDAFVVDVGERFVVKGNDRPLPHQFESEARGLEALRAAGGPLVIPRVLGFRDDAQNGGFLVIEYLEPGRRAPDFDERLGHGLASLHRHADDRGFGFDVDGYCGATPQPNPWTDRWPAFYAEHRIRHHVRLAADRGLDRGTVDLLDSIADRLEEWIDDGPSSLIHGDLWSGNLHCTADGAPALIDPAAYFGHREAELGMMSLFGGFGPAVWEAYQEAWPLEPGWRQRLGLYELYHLINHYVLFGGAYAASTRDCALRYAG
ncbi:MAG TPA: fructosamine kinase family protein [Candidatus Krumholzibacteria bacterium]|nr:fructosamine kinase family protein [Candidatus Krumholzibacteria bacterium]